MTLIIAVGALGLALVVVPLSPLISVGLVMVTIIMLFHSMQQPTRPLVLPADGDVLLSESHLFVCWRHGEADRIAIGHRTRIACSQIDSQYIRVVARVDATDEPPDGNVKASVYILMTAERAQRLRSVLSDRGCIMT